MKTFRIWCDIFYWNHHISAFSAGNLDNVNNVNNFINVKNVNKNKLKAWKFQSHRLSSFLAIKKAVTAVEGGGGKFVLFLSLFLSVHINLQYELSSHTSLFIVTFSLFSYIALLIFSHLQFQCFFFFNFFSSIFKWALSLAVTSFQTLIVFNL